MLKERRGKVKKIKDLAKIALVVAKYNTEITNGLEKGARRALKEAGLPAEAVETILVPGTVEIPLAAKLAAQTGMYEAIICLGAVIKGETKHDFFVAKIAAEGISQVSLKYSLPVTFGVLTCENYEQAKARSARDSKNRGYEAAWAALEMIQLIRQLKQYEKKDN